MIPAARIRIRRLPGPRRVRRFLGQLRGPARRSAARAVVDGPRVAWTLRRRGVRPLVAILGGERTSTDVLRGLRVAQAVDAGLGVLPLSPTCLRRSLTLARELGRLGLDGTIHLGVREADGRVEAHAWVQSGGEVLNDDPDLVATYTELAGGELERWAARIR